MVLREVDVVDEGGIKRERTTGFSSASGFETFQ